MSNAKAQPIDISDRVAAQLLLSDEFLKEGDFVHDGVHRDLTAEISGATEEPLQLPGKNAKEVKAVIAFKDKKKRLPLNKTNVKALRSMFGIKVADWIGKRVVLFWTLTEPEGGKQIRNPQDPNSPGGIRLKKAKAQ